MMGPSESKTISFSDSQPDDRTSQINNRPEVTREFFKSSCDTSKVFKACKKIFNQVAHFVEMGIKFWIWFFTVGFAGNDRLHSFGPGLVADLFRVVAFVSDEVFSFF